MQIDKIPILVGGTGFYIQAVTRDIDFTEAKQEDAYRSELETACRKKRCRVSSRNAARSRSDKCRIYSCP